MNTETFYQQIDYLLLALQGALPLIIAYLYLS